MRGWRLLRLGLHLLRGVLTVLLVYPLCGWPARHRLARRWAHALLALLGLRHEVVGGRFAPGAMLVANHVSWLDIYAINAHSPCAFVSKAEVRGWPVIGWLAARNQTVFLRRGSRGHARLVNQEIATLLEAGNNVAVFPEGTTSDGQRVLPFHAALLQAAIEAGRPVQPVAIEYFSADGHRSLVPAYVGDQSLWQSIRAIVAARGLRVRLTVLAPIDTVGAVRRELSQTAQQRIAAVLAGSTG